MTKILLALCASLLCSYSTAQTATLSADKITPYLAGIMTNDAAKLQQWYSKHLGFVIKDERNIPQQRIHFFLLEKDGDLLEIIQRADLYDPQAVLDTAKTVKFIRGYFKVGFAVTNIRDRYKTLKGQNVVIVSENISKGNADYILLKDPEGNLVQLFKKED